MQQAKRFNRDSFLSWEDRILADYAVHASCSKGRRHPEQDHPLRTAFQRDRDRVIHSRAFRRLEYKTQVFVTGANDHFRTRLTHTMEVAGIARTLSRCLGLNEDLAETIALAHDLGHPPFGHCGERALNRLLANDGGFSHNEQAIKIVDELEIKYPDFRGLNLTFEVRAGLIKHRDKATSLDGITLPQQPILEAQVADIADDLTYLCHDLDDGINAGLLTLTELNAVELWQRAGQHGHALPPDNACFASFRVRNLIDLLVADALNESRNRIQQAGIETPIAAESYSSPLIGFSPEIATAAMDLRKFLFRRMYEHPAVDDDNQRAVRWMCDLYSFFLRYPQETGQLTQQRMEEVGVKRAVADYIASMTDRYAIEQYRKFID